MCGLYLIDYFSTGNCAGFPLTLTFVFGGKLSFCSGILSINANLN
jgi:hypothetical protein